MMVRIIAIVAILTMQPLAAVAVSLGRVDVASHLGEPFFAEIPLHLDKDESLSSIFVDLASSIEYRFLEVYRDQSITSLRTAIKQDTRGLRVEIVSNKPLQSPYINLVLRVRHGRATHFKKFPIFLSLPTVATPKMERGKPIAAVTTITPPLATEVVQPTPQTPVATQKTFTPFSDWARTNRYGPMVYGDTLFTVARRLRTDQRYSVRQVAMALFNKNRKRFGKGNINLIKEGSYLNTPTASEVEALSRSEASAAIVAQTKAWKKLTQQPRFARVAEAQKTRYSKRVRVGAQGEGVRHTNKSTGTLSPKPKVVPVQAIPAPAVTTAETAPSPTKTSTPALSTEAQQRIAQLKTDNDILQATVTANNTRLAELEKKLSAVTATESSPKMKLLEARLMRIQRQLKQERSSNQGEMLLWLIYAAAGIIVLLIVVIGVLMRRQPPHPAQQQKPQTTPEPLEKTVETEPLKQEAPQDTSPPSEPKEEEAVTEEPATEEPTSPDPDVDYLTEADVYLRYGMEDEAEAQVHLALQLRPADPAAHAKLVEVRLARGNTEEADAAQAAATALLTGAALATFEQLLAPSDQKPSAEPASSEKSDAIVENPVANSLAEDLETPESDEDLLASITTSTSDNDLDALLDIGNTTPTDDDDELQSLLSEVNDSESKNEEDDGILDLSDSSDDADLESLISSLDISDEEKNEVAPEAPASDSSEDPTDLLEELEATTPSSDAPERVAQPEASDTDKTDNEVATASNDTLEGDLDFDISDLDLSKATVEEPLVNTSAVETDDDLAFDASDIDLSGIVLPSNNNTEDSTAAEAPAPSASPATETESSAPDASSIPSTKLEPIAVEKEPETLMTNEEPPSKPESGLDISLDMNDLDALLANDESEELATSSPHETDPTPTKSPQNQNVDDELGALLDGLDDLDLSGEKK